MQLVPIVQLKFSFAENIKTITFNLNDMKKTLLFLSFLIVAMESVFGQTGPTTLWSDNTDVM